MQFQGDGEIREKERDNKDGEAKNNNNSKKRSLIMVQTLDQESG